MELSHLKQFLVLAQTQNMREAAEILYISQPNLSRNLKQLENELGYPLFDRTKRRLTLNKYGEEALTYTKNIFSEITKLQQIRSIATSERIPLHFIGTGSVYYDILVPLLAKSLPWYEIHCHTCSSQNDKVKSAGEHENVLVMGTLADADLLGKDFECRFLFTDRICLSVPNKYPLASKESVHISELEHVLSNVPVILSSHVEAQHSNSMFRKHNIRIKPAYTVSYPLNSRQLTNSDGVVFDPMLLAYFPIINTRTYVPLIGEDTTFDVYIFYRKMDQSYTNAAIEYLIEFFKEINK